MLTNAALSALYLYFLITHLFLADATGAWLNILPVIAQETIITILFLTRRPTQSVSQRWQDWLVGIVGSFAPLLIRPYGPPTAIADAGHWMQIAGLAISTISLLSLGRSYGIIAANRGIKTSGAYRIVRHPMYVGHMICLVGYAMMFQTPRNAAIVGTTIFALVMRIRAEERILMIYYDYCQNAKRVKWRLVPGVY